MKAICTHDCQFRGVLVKADTVLDISEAEAKSDQGRSSFRLIKDGTAKDKDADEDKPDERGMTAADYRARLDAMNIPYHPTDNVDALRKLFDRANDQSARKGIR